MHPDLVDLEIIDSGTDMNFDIRLYNSIISGTADDAPEGEGTDRDTWICNYGHETIGT